MGGPARVRVIYKLSVGGKKKIWGENIAHVSLANGCFSVNHGHGGRRPRFFFFFSLKPRVSPTMLTVADLPVECNELPERAIIINVGLFSCVAEGHKFFRLSS
jgi:hypothetical protein